jgi:hypothetical protein
MISWGLKKQQILPQGVLWRIKRRERLSHDPYSLSSTSVTVVCLRPASFTTFEQIIYLHTYQNSLKQHEVNHFFRNYRALLDCV